jgi:hypothetical protein
MPPSQRPPARLLTFRVFPARRRAPRPPPRALARDHRCLRRRRQLLDLRCRQLLLLLLPPLLLLSLLLPRAPPLGGALATLV